MTTFDDRFRWDQRMRWLLTEFTSYVVSLGFNSKAAAVLVMLAHKETKRAR